MKRFTIIPLLLMVALLTADLHAERRALVIANSAYRSIPQLPSCAVDAASMAEAFTSIGISLHGGRAYTDLSANQIDALLHDFAAKLGPQDEAFFYFSGHGVENEGINYLLPVEFDAEYGSQVKRQAVAVPDILDLLEGTRAALRVLILDACRNPGDLLPGEPAKKGLFQKKGLAEQHVEAPETLVCFATKHGSTALAPAGPGKNSIYTGILAQEMRLPGSIPDVLRNVAREVYEVTNHAQLPFTYGALLNEHWFVKKPASSVPTAADRRAAITSVPAPVTPPPTSSSSATVTSNLDRPVYVQRPNVVVQGLRVGYVDFARLQREYHRTAEEKDRFDKMREDYRTKVAQGTMTKDEANRILKENAIELQRVLTKEIYEMVGMVAERDGMDLVFNRTFGIDGVPALAFSSTQVLVDFTDEVLPELNKR